MIALPLAVDLARDAVARQVTYAEQTETFDVPVATTTPAVRRTRVRLSEVLHRVADAVAPAEHSPAL